MTVHLAIGEPLDGFGLRQSDYQLETGPDTDLLVLSMAYHPNLVARVDGSIAPIYRTNYVLCGVPVPPGKHTVTVRYESQPLRQGLAISLISVLVVLVLLVMLGKRQRPRDVVSNV